MTQIDAFPAAPKRGRPATGKALTAAERKRRQRERERETARDLPAAFAASKNGLFQGDTLEQAKARVSAANEKMIFEWISRAIASGWPELVKALSQELIARAQMHDKP